MKILLVAFIAAALSACGDGFAPSSAEPQTQAQQQQQPVQAQQPAQPHASGIDATSMLIGGALGYFAGSRQQQVVVHEAPRQTGGNFVQPRAGNWSNPSSGNWFKPNAPAKPVAVPQSVPKPAQPPVPTPAPPVASKPVAAPAAAPKPAPTPSFASSAYKQPSRPPTVTYRSSSRR